MSQADHPHPEQPRSVLLIEDDETTAILVDRMLTRSVADRFQIVHETYLSTALRRLKAGNFDVCLLDLGLPDGSGIDSLHQVRSADARLPIVVFTGNNDERLGLQAIEMGAQDFIAKDSINGQQLSRALRFSMARQATMLGHAADAHTDTLTGLPNRRDLDRSYADLTATCDRLCVAIVDIDHFKKINDTHGHLVGDQVLRHFATLIRESKRDSMEAARFGGEEFAFLLPEIELDTALDRINALLSKIAESPFGSDPQIRVTASAGIAVVQPAESMEETFRRTDVALYEAKRSGRNCARVMR